MSSSEAQTPPLIHQQELISSIAATIATGTPAPWTSIDYRTEVLYPYAEDLAYITSPDGRVSATYPPDGTSQLVREFRAVLYRDHLGTWLTFDLTIESTGEVGATFDYDDEPSWADSIDPVYYVQDLERFPRNAEHIPGWLARELERGREQDLENDKTEGPRRRITSITEERTGR